jgi:hypothetical protein
LVPVATIEAQAEAGLSVAPTITGEADRRVQKEYGPVPSQLVLPGIEPTSRFVWGVQTPGNGHDGHDGLQPSMDALATATDGWPIVCATPLWLQELQGIEDGGIGPVLVEETARMQCPQGSFVKAEVQGLRTHRLAFSVPVGEA